MLSLNHYERPSAETVQVFMEGKADPALASQILARLDESRRVNLEDSTIVIASWENRFAAAGGVRAVTQEYARHLASQGRRVRVLTPLHTGLRNPPGALRLLSVLWIDFAGSRRRVEVLEGEWVGVQWIFVHCPGFFVADGGSDRSNPYIYSDDDDDASVGNTSPRLVRDCLFYAAAAPKVLAALNLVENVVLHLQDWETVGVALTLKAAILRREIKSAVSILVLHNPYDKALGPESWSQLSVGDAPPQYPPTFLGRLLPLLDAPPATVSREVAVDLVTDPLQTACLADHLQEHFSRFVPVGVDNGPFEKLDPPFSDAAIQSAQAGSAEDILAGKAKLRNTMKKAMAAYRPEGRWGDIDFENLADDVPLFMCVGRLDPRQKGFDVAARAIEILLDAGAVARFVLTPIVGNAPEPFVADLRDLAARFRGRVVVYPFRMEVGYFEIQAGCSFSIWPSMYEPFGGVSEFLARGTPVIARSTGGLRQQIVDFDQTTGLGNGILYQAGASAEDDGNSVGAQWKAILSEEEPKERVRKEYPVYLDQVDGLVKSIRSAIELFRDHRAYARLLSNVRASVAGYSWERASREYDLLYDVARRPGIVAQSVHAAG